MKGTGGAPDAIGAWKRRLKGSSLRLVEGALDPNSEVLASIPVFLSVIGEGGAEDQKAEMTSTYHIVMNGTAPWRLLSSTLSDYW